MNTRSQPKFAISRPADESDRVESLTRDLIAGNGGRPTCNIDAAAALIGRSATSVRRLVAVGALPASRAAQNAPMVFLCRELAKWLIAAEAAALPVNPELLRRAALATVGEGA